MSFETQREDFSVGQEKAVLVTVALPERPFLGEDPLEELRGLAETAGARVVGSTMQKRQYPSPGSYIGKGKLQELQELVQATDADVVLFDNDLSPAQVRNLEKATNVKVLDRSELILDIFATRAQTHEAKLQIELAQMQYTYPRLTRMWGHLERIAAGQGVGIGTRGPGETQLEVDRRLVRKRISVLRADIEKIQERKSRLVQQRTREHFTVCIVGYTNAGKSTLFNSLTAAGAYADDKLFATLDTKTRAWRLGRGMDVLLSDTVGFVRDLPHNLVASFKATLEEAVHADLLLHVLDVGHPHAEQQFQTVHKVLEEIGCKDKSEILLLNKTDTAEGEHNAHTWRTLNPGAIPISAKTGRGLDELLAAVVRAVRGQQVDVLLEADIANGRLLAFIEKHARVHDREYVDSRVRLQAVMGKNTLADLSRNEQVEIKKIAPVQD